MKAQETSSLYEFTTAEELPTVKIDGQPYPFRLDVEYSKLLQLKDIGEKLQAISENAERTEQEEAALPELLKAITKRMVELPPAVDEKLTDLQRFRISSIFNELVEERIGNPTGGNGQK